MDTIHILFTLWAEMVEEMDCEMKIFGKVFVFVTGNDRLREKES